jgi:ribonuclease HI
MDARPHFLLISQTPPDDAGRWQVTLKGDDGKPVFQASDREPDVRGERLELLAVVRGLEALAQPSRVTLLTPSRYVRRGIALGLAEWRNNGWSWEWYGQMTPVKNRDLWQRLDRAMSVHQVECRSWRFDPPHAVAGSHEAFEAARYPVNVSRKSGAGAHIGPQTVSTEPPRPAVSYRTQAGEKPSSQVRRPHAATRTETSRRVQQRGSRGVAGVGSMWRDALRRMGERLVTLAGAAT